MSEAEKERFRLAVAELETRLAIEKAELKGAQVALGHHVVRAPFAGQVSARHVDPGDWVAVGAPVLDLVSVDELEIHVDVSAELGGRLAVGDRATLVGTPPAAATIKGIVPALDSDTRTMRVRLAVTERPAWLIAGAAVEVEFAVKLEVGDGVIISRDALVRGPAGVRVVLFDAATNTGVQVPVEVIATAADRVLVRGDIPAGARAIVRGNERLRPGQPVRIGKPSEQPVKQ